MGTHPIFESDFDCLTEWKDLRNKQIELIENLEQVEEQKRKRIKPYQVKIVMNRSSINQKRPQKSEIQKLLQSILLSQCEKCSIEVKIKKQVYRLQWYYYRNLKNHHQLLLQLLDLLKL